MQFPLLPVQSTVSDQWGNDGRYAKTPALRGGLPVKYVIFSLDPGNYQCGRSAQTHGFGIF